VRRLLRKEHGFPVESDADFGIPAIYSTEPPVYPWADGSVCSSREAGSELKLDCSSGFGTASFVTGAMGLAAAEHVVRQIAAG
jgi:tRNA A37 threonylcarbamoyladenosine dehydratase